MAVYGASSPSPNNIIAPVVPVSVTTPTTGGTGTTPGTPSTGDALLDSLTGDQQNAAAALENLFDSYGLSTLAPAIVGYLKDGFSSDTISLLLQQTPEYKARFAANDARVKAGLPALSPAEYLSTEQSYRQIMSTAGLPVGFYDQNSDFTQWIADDVSPTEVQQRVQDATSFINSADSNSIQAAKDFGYTTGDLVAFALDRTKAEPLIAKQFAAAQVAGASRDQGVGVDQTTAEHLASEGISAQQAQQGFSQVALQLQPLEKLGNIYGTDYSEADAVSDVFDSNAAAVQKRQRLASQERGTFGGTTGVGAGSLSKTDAGAL